MSLSAANTNGVNEMAYYLTSEEAAIRLHLSPGTLCNWRVKGRGPKFVKFGAKVLYPEREVQEYEKRSVRQNTAEQKEKQK